VIHYLSFVGSVGAIYALLAIALVFIWGQAGIVNLGLAGFFAVGAYTAALLSVKMGLPFIVGVATGAVTSAMTGVALTWITRRMDADYLAIVALGFAEALRLVLQNEAWLTGGTDGISGVPMPLRISSGSLAAEVYCGLVFAFLFLCGLLVRRLIRSPFGRALRATRDDAAVASMAGKNALAFRLKAFAVGAAVMGIAGALYAHLTSYIVPDIFSPTVTVYIFLAATIGGHTRVRGALVGAAVITVLLEGSRYIASHTTVLTPAQTAAAREVLIGASLIAILNLRGAGLFSPRNERAPADSVGVENERVELKTCE
jgi:branched-chain amino acid transport system permease protein